MSTHILTPKGLSEKAALTTRFLARKRAEYAALRAEIEALSREIEETDIRRALLERHGTYDTAFQIAADYDAMLRWLWRHHLRPAYLPGVMVKMRMGGESNRSLGRIIRKSREDYRALRRNGVGGLSALALKNLSKIAQFRPRKTKQQ